MITPMLKWLTPLAMAAGSLAGQSQPQPHFVLTGAGGNPAARVLAEDPVAGSSQPLGAFPSDNLPPLAITRDPYDGDLLVALAQGGATSRVVRLHRYGGSYIELAMTTVSGRVVDLAIAGDRLLLAADGAAGGVYSAPRRGGAAALVFAQANLTAMNLTGGPASPPVLAVAWTGRPGTSALDSGVGVYSLDQGQYWFGPFAFGNPGNLEVTGVVDMPTAVPRQLLSFDDGSFAMFSGFITPPLTPLMIGPAVSGAAAALHPRDPWATDGIALGDAAYPFLYSVDPWGGPPVQLSQALPGSPIDFDLSLGAAAITRERGQPCGAEPLQQLQAGSPAQLGGTLRVELQAAAGLPVLFIAGLDDVGLGLLPAALPGGCPLEIAPDLVQLEITPNSGRAWRSIPIPPLPSLVDTIVHTQWAHYDPMGISTSNTFANWIGL
jgi:hypothetical protein